MSDYIIPPKRFRPPATIHTEKLTSKDMRRFAAFIFHDWVALLTAAGVKVNNKIILTFIRNTANQKVWLN